LNALFYGDRNWKDEQAIWLILWGLYEIVDNRDQTLNIIHGGDLEEDRYKGVDFLVDKCVKKLNYLTNKQLREDCIHMKEFPIESHSSAATYSRNQDMLDKGKPDIVFAFSDYMSNDSARDHMMEISKDAKVPSYIISRVS
jgi:hypothetical protein